MDSFELNKILGAVLGTLLFVMGVGFIAEAIYHPIENRGPGYNLPEPEPTEGGAAAEAEPEVPLGILLASASAERGASAVRPCQSCHTFEEGGPARQGPNLYNIVGAPKAHMEGFGYSDILLQQQAEGQTWTYENLNAFLTNPREYAPGTRMSYSGMRSPEQRADVLAYLQTLSASPVAFPAPEEAPAAEAPAEGDAPAGTTGETSPGDLVSDDLTTPAEGGSVETEPTAPPDAVDTPTETQSETPVEGTPVQSTTPEAPLSGADSAPAQNDAATPPANTQPATTPPAGQ
jgi:cytochrome c